MMIATNGVVFQTSAIHHRDDRADVAAENRRVAEAEAVRIESAIPKVGS